MVDWIDQVDALDAHVLLYHTGHTMSIDSKYNLHMYIIDSDHVICMPAETHC